GRQHREGHRHQLRDRRAGQRQARAGRLLGGVVRPLQDDRARAGGDRRRARRQADDREAQHRREPADRPRLPGHVDPDHDGLPGRQAGQEHHRRQAQGCHPERPRRLPL
ncbi:MAG: Thioredoxin, partial [uncultured Blastococcus sp.]